MIYSAAELMPLLEAYLAHTQVSRERLSQRIADSKNNKSIRRLLRGDGCSYVFAEQASEFLVREWPADLAWPEGVPHPGRCQFGKQ